MPFVSLNPVVCFTSVIAVLYVLDRIMTAPDRVELLNTLAICWDFAFGSQWNFAE